MRIPEEKVDEIYNAADIVEVVSEYVSNLKKRGGNYWALSPFTSEKTPSFAVSAAKGIYKCFSTGKGGNAVNFVMEMEGFTYPEALRHLAKKFNVELPEETESDEQKEYKDQRQSLYIVNEFASRFFHEQLLHTEEGKKIGLSYFKERGILESTIETFQLGYAPDSWEAFTQNALQHQHQEAYLTELGLSGISEKSGRLYDRFRGRIMFPITNQVGKVVGFGGRVLTSEKTMAKYINSPESSIYNKSQVLYGLFQAKQAIRNEEQCILTEGYMDTIVLHQSGIHNVVASSGTALTVDQIRLIRRFTPNVLMIYDGDAAGVKAALRGIDLLLQEEMNAKVLVLPDNHDPDSYVRDFGTAAFKEFAAKEAQSFLDFKLGVLRASADPNDPQQQAQLVRDLASTLAYIPDLLQRELFIKYTAEKVGLGEGLVAQAVQDAHEVLGRNTQRENRRQRKFEQKASPEAEVKALKSFEKLELAHQEKELLRILINHHDQVVERPSEREPGVEPETEPEVLPLVALFQEELSGLNFENTVFDQLKQEVFSAGAGFNVQRYLNHEDPAICNLVSDLLTVVHSPSENWKKRGITVPPIDQNLSYAVKSALYHYQRKKVNKLLQELREEMKAMTAENEEELMAALIHLNQVRSDVNRKLGIIVEG